MAIKKSTLYISVVIVVVIIIIIGMAGKTTHVDCFVLLTFGVNLVFSVSQLIRQINKHTMSGCMLFWLFTAFFFCVAPMLQYANWVFPWTIVPTTSELIVNNILIFVWCCSFAFGSRYKIKIPEREKKTYQINNLRRIVIVVVSIVIVLFYLRNVGFSNLLFRSTNTIDDVSQMKALLTTHLFKNILLFSAIFALISKNKTGKLKAIDVIAIVCFIVGCFPTGIPRYMMAAFYGGILVFTFKKAREKRWYTLVLIIGLVLIFPVFSIFRYADTITSGNVLNIISDSLSTTYLSGDYDAYSIIILARRYVQQFGIDGGKQLLGALLFFIPRNVWPSKPIGTGATIIDALDQFYFTNVSAPLPAESYVNFGLIGVVLIGLFLGLVFRTIDERYWFTAEENSYLYIIYPCFILYFFFILRGDLLSSWAYTFSNIVVGYIMHRFCFKKSKS
jgi:oligosaccharide repeat unit polymerase